MEGGRSQHPRAGSLSLIIPAYNEAAGIHQAIAEADAALVRLAGDYEILIVDDGSSDATAHMVRAAMSAHPRVRLLQHDTNRGYSAALRTGFEAARFDQIAFTDADCQFHLNDLAFLIPLTEQNHLVVGYRLNRQDPLRRRLLSWGYNTLARTLLGTQVRDCDCALKVFRRDALPHLLPETQGFFVNTEMLTRARQLGYRVAEVGVRHRPRLHGRSKVSLWEVPRTLQTLLPFWWTHVLFAGREVGAEGIRSSAPCDAPAGQAVTLSLLTVLCVAALLFFSRLGVPLQEPEEPRYAEIPRQMLEAGQVAVPVLHGSPYYDKPPLLYWSVMASYSTFGVHDWAAKLVSCAAAFLTVLVTYFWGKRLLGPRTAFAGAMILCLSARFVFLGRLLTMNGLLCLCVTAGLAAGHLALHKRRLHRGWWLLSALACGLGLLTKGPVAAALIGVPLLAFQALDPRGARPGSRAWTAYAAVAAGMAAPWYVTLAVSQPEFVSHFFWKHHVLRFVAPFDHAKPVWYYIPDLILGMMPWSLLLVPFARFLVRKRAADATRRPAPLGFFLLSSLWSMLFHSLAGSKRSGYILPAMPPLSLALGCYLDVMLQAASSPQARASLARAWSSLAARAAALVMASGLVVIVLASAAGIVRPAEAAALAGASVIALALCLAIGTRLRPESSWMATGMATFASLFIALHSLLPGYARCYSLRAQARPLAASARDQQVPVVSYPRRWDSVSFYLRRNDVRVYTPADRHRLVSDLRASPRTLAFIKSDHSLDELQRALPSSLEFVPRVRRGTVTVGWVRHRPEVPPTLFAELEGR
jgi:dolichol-phosphate mannosyltransferase